MAEDSTQIENMFFIENRKESFMKRYRVNLFLDNSHKEHAPVIREMNPNYYNLFGKIEYVNELEAL